MKILIVVAFVIVLAVLFWQGGPIIRRIQKWDEGPVPAVELIGLTGRITVSVTSERQGQITLPIEGRSEAYTAYTTGGETLDVNARAVVVEQTGPKTVLVTAC